MTNKTRFYAEVWAVEERYSRPGHGTMYSYLSYGTRYTWHFRVYNPAGKVVAMDNTGDWRKIYDNAHRLVRTFNECQTRGIKIKQPKWIKEIGL